MPSSDTVSVQDIVRQTEPVSEQRIKKCAGCGEFLISKGFTFWLVQPVRAGFVAQGLRERGGLSMMMGGNAALGSMFAASPVAQVVDRPDEICACEDCAMTLPLAALCLLGDCSWA